MSQEYTLIAFAALIVALFLLVLYYHAESRSEPSFRRHLPGRYFIPILVGVTLAGMAITESQGVCSLSPWGFIIGMALGLSAEGVMFLRTKKTIGVSH